MIVAVVVTHRRPVLLGQSLKVLTTQSHPIDHLVVVDNGNEPEVAELVARFSVPTTYLGSAHNLGGAGGFALGMLYALTLGADWVWLADDDGRPNGPEILAALLNCAQRHNLMVVSPVVCDIDEPDRLAFPLRRGLVWRRHRSELMRCERRRRGGSALARVLVSGRNTAQGSSEHRNQHDVEDTDDDLLPGIASLFNGALFAASAIDRVGVPDIRLFVRGDEVEIHRRLVRSGVPFGTCLTAAYLHPNGAKEFKPIFGGRMHAQYPDDAGKRHYTYRNRGYLMAQPGMRKLIFQEWIRFGWFFLITRRDPNGLRQWRRLRRFGRREQFVRPGETVTDML